MVTQNADFTYHVGDTLPGIPLRFTRNGVPEDLTLVSHVNFYLRPRGAAENTIIGTATLTLPKTDGIVVCELRLATPATGFPTPGLYIGQAEAVWTNGRETSRREFTVNVLRSFR